MQRFSLLVCLFVCLYDVSSDNILRPDFKTFLFDYLSIRFLYYCYIYLGWGGLFVTEKRTRAILFRISTRAYAPALLHH